MERTLPKVFCIYPLLWTVFFPHGRHSFYIIQVEKDLAVLYCNYYRSWTTASTHPSIHKNSVMVPHGSLTTNYTNVHKNPYIIENNFNSYVLYRNLNTWSPTVPAALLFPHHSLTCLCFIVSACNWPSVTHQRGAWYLQPHRPFSSPFSFFSKGHIFTFTAAQSTRCSAQLFLPSFQLVRLFIRIKGRREKEAHGPWCGAWLCMRVNPCRLLINGKWIHDSPHTIPETEQNTAGKSGNTVICILPEKSNA